MGADQVGYIVKGPAVLDPKLCKQAADRFAKRMAKMRKAKIIRCPECGEDIIWNKSGVEEDECPNCANTMVGTLAKLTTPAQVRKFARECYEAWPPESRDRAKRPDPDDPTQILVFAGTQTWGDEPDGFGYQLLKKLMLTGLGKLVGIR